MGTVSVSSRPKATVIRYVLLAATRVVSECISSSDMWWLALSLFVLCIIEVSNALGRTGLLITNTSIQQAPLMAAEDATRFTIFALSRYNLVCA